MEKLFVAILFSGIVALTSCNERMSVKENRGQFLVTEAGKPVLQYNYSTVPERDVIETWTANIFVREKNDTFVANPSIYAVSRSNYIHPVYGLQGELLTRDWSRDHPHHRGIYWAWPEVDFGKSRGDLHALQVVFARPTGRIKQQANKEFAQIEAENIWKWGDSIPVVKEVALIRVYRERALGRIIDLAFRFDALRDSISIARRATNLYGGLNIRMQTPQEQVITTHRDSMSILPVRAWSDLSGLFTGAKTPSGLMVLQHRLNPDYPGDWVQYPNLSWCQPTFPASGTRYPLSKGSSLVLRFRIFIHPGRLPEQELANAVWDKYNSEGGSSMQFTIE